MPQPWQLIENVNYIFKLAYNLFISIHNEDMRDQNSEYEQWKYCH